MLNHSVRPLKGPTFRKAISSPCRLFVPLEVCVLLFVALFFVISWLPYTADAAACQSNGTGGGNWASSASWTSCGSSTPGSADTVTILSGDTITLNTTASVGTTTINAGGTLTEDGNARTLNVGNAWVNNGTFTANTSTITFDVGDNKTFTFIGNTTFNNLTVSPRSSVSTRTFVFTGYTATTTGTFSSTNGSAGINNFTGGTIAALGNVTSPGNETTLFGAATKAALIKFQKAKAIKPAVGYFGPVTRKAIGEGR